MARRSTTTGALTNRLGHWAKDEMSGAWHRTRRTGGHWVTACGEAIHVPRLSYGFPATHEKCEECNDIRTD